MDTNRKWIEFKMTPVMTCDNNDRSCQTKLFI